ncbi:MAG TPA: hypothetical protein VMW68_05260 [Methyloceanibacter sp.]|nr:hypothetical protein [Methyloceanibacter sp.]
MLAFLAVLPGTIHRKRLLCETNEREEKPMSKVVYKIIKHENGWAYQARGTISVEDD